MRNLTDARWQMSQAGERWVFLSTAQSSSDGEAMADRSVFVAGVHQRHAPGAGGIPEKSKGLEYEGFTPDWKTFFAVDELGRVVVWEVATAKVLKSLQGPPPPISVDFSRRCYSALGAQRSCVYLT